MAGSPGVDPGRRVAVVGCGRMGQLHAAAAAATPGCRIVACGDLVLDRAQALAAQFGGAAFTDTSALLATARPKIVFVATSDDQHHGPVLAALRAGCHVFCEKPLAAHVAEAAALVVAADQAGVHLAVNYNRRFGCGYQRASELLQQDAIGSLEHLVLHVTDRTPRPPLCDTPTIMLTTLLTHHFDLVRWLAPPVQSVTARLQPRVGCEQLCRNASIVLGLAGGAIATIVAGYRDQQSRTSETCVLAGSRGTLSIEDVTRRVTWIGDRVDERTVFEPDPFRDGLEFYDTVGRHVADFLQRIAHGAAPLVTGRDGLWGLRLADVVRQAAESGRTICIDSSAEPIP